MKYILFVLSFIVSLHAIASTPLTGNISATVDVKDSNFLVYYKNSETKIITLQTYSKDGKLLKTSPLESDPWKNFSRYNLERKRSFLFGENMYVLKFHSSIAIINKSKIKGMSYYEKENLLQNTKKIINLSALLPAKLKIENLSNIFIDEKYILNTAWVEGDSSYSTYFFIFDLKEKRFIDFYKIGIINFSLSGGNKVSRIIKYKDGYIIIWKYWPSEKNNPDEISPLYCSYLDFKNKTVSKYIIEKKVRVPMDISTGLIGDVLCVAYNQLNKKNISEIKTKFINLKDLLKQKPVSISGPEKLDRKEAVPQK